MKGRVWIFLAALTTGAALLPASASAGTIDQEQTTFGMFTDGGVNSFQSLAQTFTAGITGRLDQVDLMLDKVNSSPDPITVEIRNTAGGKPGTTALASASIPNSAIGTTKAFVSATFGTPAGVTAGTQYALVAHSMDMTGLVGWSFQQATDPYPRGGGFNSDQSPPIDSWNEPPGDDFAFRTYVAPSPPSAPPVAPHKRRCKHKKKKRKGGAVVAKKKCKKKHHH
jgi:hypothetical protein